MMATQRNYLIVTASYWGFTLVDGALRMLVLLHFFRLGYSPFTLAFLFLLYEAAGIVANLPAAVSLRGSAFRGCWRSGRRCRSQACSCFPALVPVGARRLSVAWVVAAQGISGIAKDLTKTASKSAIKATSAEAAASCSDGLPGSPARRTR